MKGERFSCFFFFLLASNLVERPPIDNPKSLSTCQKKTPSPRNGRTRGPSDLSPANRPSVQSIHISTPLNQAMQILAYTPLDKTLKDPETKKKKRKPRLGASRDSSPGAEVAPLVHDQFPTNNPSIPCRATCAGYPVRLLFRSQTSPCIF